MSKEMREHVDNFKNFLLKENLNQYTIYTENELKRYIKNLYNSSFQSSVKDIELSLSDKFMKIKSKHRFKYGGENKDSHIEIFRGDEFEEVLKTLLKHKWNDANIEIKNRTNDIVLYVYYS
jgi:hypothetical protein